MASYNLRTVLKMMGQNILNWVKSNCVNNLLSTSTNLPLAAAQGKVLDEKIGQVTQSLTQLFTFENINILSDYFTGTVKLLDSRAYREGNHVRMEVRFNLEASLSHTIPLFYINGKFAPKTKTSIIVGSINMNKTAYVSVTGRLDSTNGYYVFNQTLTETLEPGLYYVSIDYSLLA